MAKRSKSHGRATKLGSGLADARVVTEGCHMLHADTVNVALSSRNVALTFYTTVPDPAVMEGKGLVRYAQAVVQLPLPIAAQLPRLLNQNFLEHLDLSQATPEDLNVVVAEMQAVADQFRHMVEQVRNEPEDNSTGSK